MSEQTPPMKTVPYGALPGGGSIEHTTICNLTGMKVEILNYGATLKSIEVPDANDHVENVVLGFGDLDSYLTKSPYFGATIGRFANRIAQGQFVLDGVRYQLAVNEPPNNLHGGQVGFDKRLWSSTLISDTDSQGIQLGYHSPDGEEGFPGNLDAVVTYRVLHAQNTLTIDYQATTDKPTIVNLTNHSYFNLSGEGTGSIEDHLLEINADHYLPVNTALIPQGCALPVHHSPMDFTTPHPIGERLRDGTEQLVLATGYDHTYVLNRDQSPGDLSFAARVVDPKSGRTMEVWTTEPGLDFYCGNFLDASLTGPRGRAYRQGDGFALEPEHFSDAPNQPQFASTVLRPGEIYRSRTEFRFGAQHRTH
jgi:aldose 1-epimerase